MSRRSKNKLLSGQINNLKPKSKFTPITSDMIIDDPGACLREQQANLLNPDKFEGLTEARAFVYKSVSLTDQASTDDRILASMFDYFSGSRAKPRRICYCWVDGICDGNTWPSDWSSGQKRMQSIKNLHKFEYFGEKKINDFSLVLVRYYNPSFQSNGDDIHGIVSEILQPGSGQQDPFGQGALEAFAASAVFPEGLSPVTPEQILDDAARYDNPASLGNPIGGGNPKSAPSMARSNELIEKLNPDFKPIVKSLMLRCWEELGIELMISSTYRSVETQRKMRQEWENKGGKSSGLPAPAAGISFHNAGIAVDFNPRIYLPDGSTKVLTARSNSREEWIQSGIGNVIKSLNLRWGIDFPGNFDPIHVDMGDILNWNGNNVAAFVLAADSLSIPVNQWPVYKYIEDPTGASFSLPTSDPYAMRIYGESSLDEEKLQETRVTVDPE